MLAAGAFEEDGDVPAFKLGHDLAERPGARRVEHLDVGQAQDHDSNVTDRGQLGQEALRRPEEEGAVEPIRDDVITHQFGLVGRIDLEERSPLATSSRCSTWPRR